MCNEMKTTVLLLIVVLSQADSTIIWEVNPGCNSSTICGHADMMHVLTDSHQYLWSTQNGLSGIVFSQNNNLSVNWTLYNDNKRAVSVDTSSSFGWDLSSIFVANDTHNQTLDLSSVSWFPISPPTNDSSDVLFRYSTSFLDTRVLVSNKTSRVDYNPSLQYNANVSIFDMNINMSKIPGITIQNPNKATLGLHVASENTFSMNKSRTFDDEYSPGLFNYNFLQDEHPDGVYMLWRPVVYTSSDRNTISPLKIKDVSNKTVTTSALLAKYYKTEQLQTLYLDISPPDGKKQLSDSIYWTGCMGRGEPETDSLSLIGTILILIIVGLPCLAIIVGSCIIIYKKRVVSAREPSGYRAI